MPQLTHPPSDQIAMTRITADARQQLKQVAAFYNETLLETLSRLAAAEWHRMMRASAEPQETATHD